MNWIMKKISTLLLLSLLLTAVLPGAAFAAGASCTVSIPAEVKVSGEDIPDGSSYKIVLETKAPSNPMPRETQMTVKDKGTVYLGPMTYTVPGDYQYRIYQKHESKENFSYDDAVFNVTVRVVNDGKGGLCAEVWAFEDQSDKKTGSIVFENHYDKPSSGGGHDSGHKNDPAPAAPETQPAVQQAAASILSAPKTGDSAVTALWGVGMAAALAVIAAILLRRKKSRIDS